VGHLAHEQLFFPRSQAGAWEPETKGFGGTGILPVRCIGWKPVPLNLSFWLFQQDFSLNFLI